MAIYQRFGVLATAALALGLAASGCNRPAEAPPAASSAHSAASSASSSAQAAAEGGDLATLVPVPPNTVTNKGPDPIADDGLHRYFKVSGTPKEVMDAFKTALEGKGWTLTTSGSSRGDHGDSGATLIGSLGDAYGVFDGGGYETTTHIDACTWPTKPAEANCRRGG